jgi:hypothetical protein
MRFLEFVTIAHSYDNGLKNYSILKTVNFKTQITVSAIPSAIGFSGVALAQTAAISHFLGSSAK